MAGSLRSLALGLALSIPAAAIARYHVDADVLGLAAPYRLEETSPAEASPVAPGMGVRVRPCIARRLPPLAPTLALHNCRERRHLLRKLRKQCAGEMEVFAWKRGS